MFFDDISFEDDDHGNEQETRIHIILWKIREKTNKIHKNITSNYYCQRWESFSL